MMASVLLWSEFGLTFGGGKVHSTREITLSAMYHGAQFAASSGTNGMASEEAALLGVRIVRIRDPAWHPLPEGGSYDVIYLSITTARIVIAPGGKDITATSSVALVSVFMKPGKSRTFVRFRTCCMV